MDTHNEIHIAFCVDDNFCLPLCVLIKSIQNHTHRKLCLHVVSQSLSHTNMSSLKELATKSTELTFYILGDLEASKFNIHQNFSARLTVSTYFRFLLSSLLPKSIAKLLFLDADMLAREDVGLLYDSNIQGATAAVVDDSKLSASKRWRTLGLQNGHYFNAGLMLMDMQKWRANAVSEKCFELLEQGKTWEYNDQDILNVVLDGQLHMLDQNWNRQSYGLDSKSDEKAKIVHFTGAEKPWHISCIHPFCEEFREVLKQTTYASDPLVNYLDADDHVLIERLKNLNPNLGKINVLIYGCGQRGRRIFHYIQDNHKEIQVSGFIDKAMQGQYQGLPIFNQWPVQSKDKVIIGSEAFRNEIIETLTAAGVAPTSVI
jgi:lipopolysaccharide biosynthesis glycosyltransferase